MATSSTLLRGDVAAARKLMTRHPDEALLFLNEAIKDGQTALDESRNAIQDLSWG